MCRTILFQFVTLFLAYLGFEVMDTENSDYFKIQILDSDKIIQYA